MLAPGEWDDVHFEARSGSTVEVSAWERNGGSFDILLLPTEDILEQAYRAQRALIGEFSINDFEDTYTFTRNGSYGVVLSNENAQTKEKVIHLRISLDSS